MQRETQNTTADHPVTPKDNDLYEEALNAARIMAEDPDYAESPSPSALLAEFNDALNSFCFLNRRKIEDIRELAPSNVNPIEALLIGWKAAFETRTIREYEGKIIFPIPVMRADGRTPVEVSIRRSDFTPSDDGEILPWFICYVNSYVKPREQTVQPSKAIEKFAWLGSWDDFLSLLAQEALPEKWDFDDEPDEDGHRRAILKSYICTTFYRLQRENKIRIAADESLAAFNTGLVNTRYDDLYACFTPSEKGIPWEFAGFTTAGARGLGKRIVSEFNPLPEPPEYFERKEDMLFDLDKDLIIDFDHVIIDNIARLPLDFLAEEMRSDAEAQDIIAQIERAHDQADRRELFVQLAGIIEDSPRMFRRIRSSLDEAIDMAKRRIRWNFKTAIPSYYPRANAMSLLLPLSLMDDERVDAALVVQLMPSGNYQGQTILTMSQAYKNARLICRPDSDWLTTAQDFAEDESELEEIEA